MGQLDRTNVESYETRELAWELQQDHPDAQRIKFFLDEQADLRVAMRLANIQMKDLLKKPSLRQLKLQRLLEPVLENAGL
jgi:predicted DNA binding CopG/RHH family protein